MEALSAIPLWRRPLVVVGVSNLKTNRKLLEPGADADLSTPPAQQQAELDRLGVVLVRTTQSPLLRVAFGWQRRVSFALRTSRASHVPTVFMVPIPPNTHRVLDTACRRGLIRLSLSTTPPYGPCLCHQWGLSLAWHRPVRVGLVLASDMAECMRWRWTLTTMPRGALP